MIIVNYIQVEEHCRWCGQFGGRMRHCDACPEWFCEPCILRNFGAQYEQETRRNRQWQCFYCHPELMKKEIQYFLTFKEEVLRISSENIRGQPWPEPEELHILDGPEVEQDADN